MAGERATDAAPVTLTNEGVAMMFHEIADVLEITGELSFKVAAYRRAAD